MRALMLAVGMAGLMVATAVVAGPGLPPCVGDTNGDHRVDVNDLNNVVLDWGTDGSANGGDITGPRPGGSPDGTTDVNDLNAVIVGWGDCALVNDDCEDAAHILGAVFPDFNGQTEFHSFGATLDPAAPPFSCGFPVSDVWFDYVTPPDIFQSGGSLHIATCGSGYDTIIEVYAGHECPPDDAASLLCVDDEGCTPAGCCDDTFQGSGTVLGLQNNMPLKIRIGGWSGDDEGWGNLNLVWERGEIFSPLNDHCEHTIGDPQYELVAGGPAIHGGTLHASPDPEAAVCGVPPEARGVWFWLTGDGAQKEVRVTCETVNVSYRLDVFCVPFDCEKLWCLGADFDECVGPEGHIAPIAAFCTEPGATYAVLVSAEEGGLFEISMTGAVPCAPPNACGAP